MPIKSYSHQQSLIASQQQLQCMAYEDQAIQPSCICFKHFSFVTMQTLQLVESFTHYSSKLFEANSIYMVHPNLRLLQGVACITISCSTVWKQNLYMLSLPHFQISNFPKKKGNWEIQQNFTTKASSIEDNYKFSKYSQYLDQDSVKQNQFMVPNKASPQKLHQQKLHQWRTNINLKSFALSSSR